MHSEANDPMHIEWQAWHLVIERMEVTFNIADINDEAYAPLITAIQAWGELLAELRLSQDPDVVKEARMQAVAKCLRTNFAPR